MESFRQRRYWTLAAPHEALLEVKGSKFYAFVWPVKTVGQAMDLVASTSDPKASHNCFAYKIGAEFRSTDDGEPSGTAGRPILSAIEAEGLDEACALVVRYFGGTKLGAGGLVRAYGAAARDCLRAAPREFVIAKVLHARRHAAAAVHCGHAHLECAPTTKSPRLHSWSSP